MLAVLSSTTEAIRCIDRSTFRSTFFDFEPTIAQHERAVRLFQKGELSLRAELPGYDTGAWTLYSLAGAEATLEYHQLATDFLGNLCEKLGPGLYCDTAERFESYETESPLPADFGTCAVPPAPAPSVPESARWHRPAP